MIINETEIPAKPGIYRILNKINQKSYIGESNNILARFKKNHRSANGGQIIHNAIKLHGWENFEVEILQDFEIGTIDKLTLLALEAAYIEFYNSLTEGQGGYGYNICPYGTYRKDLQVSEETRKKISLAGKGKRCGKDNPAFGKPSWNKGLIKETNPTMKQMSETLTGRERSTEHCEKLRQANLGKKLSPETCEKMSQSKMGEKNNFYGKQHSKETKQKLRERFGKPVKQINLITKEVIKVWPSIKEAQDFLNLKSGIGNVCKGKAKMAGGYYWEYVTPPTVS